jgi:hypothetical protein
MSVYSIWPYFIGMAFLLSLVASPLFRGAEVPPSPRGGSDFNTGWIARLSCAWGLFSPRSGVPRISL